METKHRVLIYAVFETTITKDDPAEAKAIAGILFKDDISSKSEMFSVRVERVEAKPLGKHGHEKRKRKESKKRLDRDSGAEGHNGVWGT